MGYPCTHYSKLAGDEKDVEKTLGSGDVKFAVKSSRKHNRRSGWNMCLWITGITLGLLFLFATAVSVGSILWMRHQVKRFTVTDPGETLPIHPLPDAELQVVKDRVKLFGDTLRAGKVPEEDLVLTQDELNGFIAHSDYLRGHANIRMEHEKMSLDMSLPARFLPGGKDRYFVASGYMDIASSSSSSEPKKSVITTHLDTKYKVRGVEGAFWNAVMSLYRQKEEPHKLVLNLESGNFLNWVAPDDFIAEKVNLLDYILYDEDHHHHDHGHHHHDHDHHHHHHHHHHHDHEDCEDAKKIVESIESITLQEGRIVIHASPASMAPEETALAEVDSGSHHHRFLRARSSSTPQRSTARMLWKLLA